MAEEPVSILHVEGVPHPGNPVHCLCCEPCLMSGGAGGGKPGSLRDERAWCEVFSERAAGKSEEHVG